MKSFQPRFGLQMMSRIVAVAILLLGVLTSPPSTLGAVVPLESGRDLPYVKFLNPTIGACLSSDDDLKVSWVLVITGHESEADAFRAKHEHSEVCIAIGSEGAETCVGALSQVDIWLRGYLPEGCYTMAGWFREANGRPGSVVSVPFSVGPNCSAACNQMGDVEVGEAGDTSRYDGDTLYAASSSRFALGFPPNAITGGCLKSGGADPAGSVGGGGCRCTEGCCEAGSPMSMCEHASFDQWHNSTAVSAAAPEEVVSESKSGAPAPMARRHRKRLPHCSECLPEVTAPNRAMLPRFSVGVPLVRRYLDTVKATVLNSAYTNFNEADFDSLQALTMVGDRRIDHLDALIQDVLYRDVPGDFIECGCWRGGVGLFAAAAFEAYATAASSVTALVYPLATNVGSSSSRGGTELPEGGGLGGGLRRVWLADSFSGLPPVDTAAYPADAAHQGSDDIQLLKANSVGHVERAAAALQLSHRTRILPGFFNESLPAALATSIAKEEEGDASRGSGGAGGEVSGVGGVLPAKEGTLAILRLDGDLYQSTLESLHYLYPLLAVGGHVIIDDFTDWEGCRNAVTDYRTAHGLTEPLQITWHAFGSDASRGELTRGIWWTKAKSGPTITYAPGSGDTTSRVAYARGTVHLPLLARSS